MTRLAYLVIFTARWLLDRDERVWDDVAAMIPAIGEVDWYRHERDLRRGDLRG